MDPLKPLRELWERRLWPFAVLLLVALAAVPLLLSRDPEPVAAPPVAAAAAADDASPVVGVADAGARDAARTVLGSEKDPFRAAQTPTPEPRDEEDGDAPSSGTDGDDSAPGADDSGSDTGGSGGGTPAPDTAPSPAPAPTPDADPAPQQTFPLNSLRVRFGTTENPDHAERTLSRLSGLPKGTTPALLYMGLLDDRETAVFLVREGVSVVGDGTCRPNPGNCERLLMRKGDIQFVGVGGGDSAGEYQVEILKVNTRRTTSASAARRSRTHTFPGGRRWLRALDEQAGEFRYDPATGVLGRD